MVTTNLDGFNLVNRRRFTKFAKLSTCQTFPLYGIGNAIITPCLICREFQNQTVLITLQQDLQVLGIQF